MKAVETTETSDIVSTLPDILGQLAAAKLDDDELFDAIGGLSPEWQEWFFRVHFEQETPRPEPPTTASYTTTIDGDSALLEALDLPNNSWRLFLHPKQRHIVASTSRSIAVSGPPGSGKTVILVNRFLSENDVGPKVLLTYSNSLVGHLRDIAQSSTRAFGNRVVFHDEFSRKPTPGRSGFALDSGALIYVNQAGRVIQIAELLIDEFQDTPPPTFAMLAEIQRAGKTRIVVAYDLEQTLFSANNTEVVEFSERCSETINLSYVYRSSREIMSAANTVAVDLRNELAFGANGLRVSYGLSGPPPVFLEVNSLNAQIKLCNEIVAGHEARYDPDSIALIYVQHYNPSFSRKSAEEAALKNHPRLKSYYHFASTVKGREFYAGVLFVSDSYLARRDVGRSGLDLRINTFFMAATRFREELTVVYRAGSPFAQLIADAKIIRGGASRPT